MFLLLQLRAIRKRIRAGADGKPDDSRVNPQQCNAVRMSAQQSKPRALLEPENLYQTRKQLWQSRENLRPVERHYSSSAADRNVSADTKATSDTIGRTFTETWQRTQPRDSKIQRQQMGYYHPEGITTTNQQPDRRQCEDGRVTESRAADSNRQPTNRQPTYRQPTERQPKCRPALSAGDSSRGSRVYRPEQSTSNHLPVINHSRGAAVTLGAPTAMGLVNDGECVVARSRPMGKLIYQTHSSDELPTRCSNAVSKSDQQKSGVHASCEPPPDSSSHAVNRDRVSTSVQYLLPTNRPSVSIGSHYHGGTTPTAPRRTLPSYDEIKTARYSRISDQSVTGAGVTRSNSNSNRITQAPVQSVQSNESKGHSDLVNRLGELKTGARLNQHAGESCCSSSNHDSGYGGQASDCTLHQVSPQTSAEYDSWYNRQLQDAARKIGIYSVLKPHKKMTSEV